MTFVILGGPIFVVLVVLLLCWLDALHSGLLAFCGDCFLVLVFPFCWNMFNSLVSVFFCIRVFCVFLLSWFFAFLLPCSLCIDWHLLAAFGSKVCQANLKCRVHLYLPSRREAMVKVCKPKTSSKPRSVDSCLDQGRILMCLKVYMHMCNLWTRVGRNMRHTYENAFVCQYESGTCTILFHI